MPLLRRVRSSFIGDIIVSLPIREVHFARVFVIAGVLSVIAGSQAAERVDYVEDVLPIFETYCIGCHSSDDNEGGFVMDSHAAVMQGGEEGIAITAGQASSSRLFLMAAGKLEPVMPPDGEQGPSDEELAVLADWIDQGAKGPDGDVPIKRSLRVPDLKTSNDVVHPITAVATTRASGLTAIARFGRIEIRDADGNSIHEMAGDFGKVNGVTFDSDGDELLIATGLTGAYGSALRYSVEDGTLLSELVGHRDIIYSAVYSPDQKLIATAGYDRDIILWDRQTGEKKQTLSGHNGAVFDLDFSPDGCVLVSASADETIKVWNVDTGKRLDTLGQSEGEVLSVAISPDGKHIVAGSADNRVRVWELRSVDAEVSNPLVATRFVDESAIVNLRFSVDGKILLAMSEAGNVKLIDPRDWSLGEELKNVGSEASDLCLSADGKNALISSLNGTLLTRAVTWLSDGTRSDSDTVWDSIELVYLDLDSLTSIKEEENASDVDDQAPTADVVRVPRGAQITGSISKAGESDRYRWSARRGECWAIDANAAKDSRIDPTISILDDQGNPVLRVRLQAIRDSYFTFRGKNSSQVNDFRMFAWEEMNLNDYLYAAGEVTRLWMHPRGPDSGFNVYPNEGNRWTYFGTSHATHALGEPAYVVRPLGQTEQPAANGLPTFDVFYQNDDDPSRRSGNASRLIFTAPEDADFQVEISDTRKEGGENYGYLLNIRPAEPGFVPKVAKISKPIRRGSGREVVVRVDRVDGFDGSVLFDLGDLPPGLHSNFPVIVEPGQRYAHGAIWADPDAADWDGKFDPKLVARASVAGRMHERVAGTAGELKLEAAPSAVPRIRPVDGPVDQNSNWTLTVRRGETVSAVVVIDRSEGFDKEVSFGKENAGRNATFGVYVDNIGLNGLLIRSKDNEREFSLTADPACSIGKRSFFLTANIDGGVTTVPITVNVIE